MMLFEDISMTTSKSASLFLLGSDDISGEVVSVRNELPQVL